MTQRWMINDVLGFLMRLSRLFCLAPVRFVKIRNDTFVYISQPLLFFSGIIVSIMQLYTMYQVYVAMCYIRGDFQEAFLGIFNVCVIIVFVSYAVLYNETRMKNFMRCLTKLEKAIRGLQSTEEISIKKWHVLIMFILLGGGTLLVLVFYIFIYSGAIHPVTAMMFLQYPMSLIVQLQFLYFALYVSFILKIVKEQLQEELSKIIKSKDHKRLDNFTTAGSNIRLESINRAIDMIGMVDELFPDIAATENKIISQKIRQINDSYLLACEVILDLSSTDDFLLFLLLIFFSFSIVFSSYGIIRIINDDGLSQPAKLIIHCFQLLVLVMRALIIVEPCHEAHERISEIRFLVCEMMCHVKSTDPLYRTIDGLFHQFLLSDISYTALGLCKIGRPLVSSIIAVATTILSTAFDL